VSGELAKLKMQLERCQAHARFLNESLEAMAADLPFDADALARYRSAPSAMAYLDQFVYRFGRLQDTMGRQLLPLILEVVKEPLPEEATFMEKLDRLERLGIVPSVEQWDEIRELRNALTHDYPEAAERLAATINQAVDAARSLVAILEGNAQWLREKLPSLLRREREGKS